MTKPTAASSHLARLNPFVGAWNTDGEMKTSEPGQPTKFKANDEYEWLPGGHFLLHRFDADMPTGRVQGLEVIGQGPESDSYSMHSFDSMGNAGSMQARLENDIWTFEGAHSRFSGGFRDNGKRFEGLWEMRSGDGAAWEPWMTIRLTKSD